MAIDRKVRAEIIKKLYAGVPVSTILKTHSDVDRTTIYRWKKKVDQELAERKSGPSQNATIVAENATTGEKVAFHLKKEDLAFPPIDRIDLDNLADHALLGLWDGLTRIKDGLDRVSCIDCDATRESLNISYLKEYRQYVALAGRWGGLDDKVDSDNPILTAFTEALKKNRRGDDE